MTDPQHLGLGELGQRVQAMSDPAPDPHLRPYQGSVPATHSTASNGRVIPPYEPVPEPASTATQASVPQTPNQQPAAHPIGPPYTSTTFKPFAAQPASAPPSSSPAASVQPSPAAPYSPWEGVSTPASRTSSPVPPTGSEPRPPASSSTPAQWSVPPSAAPAGSEADMDPNDPNSPKSGILRAINAVKSALPVAQKLLPLLDGNVISAIGALLAPVVTHHPQPAPPPQVHVDLEPVERAITEVRNSHRELRTQVQEQVASMKKVEDQLERVREATDRNTLEQQELVEDLRAVGNKITTFVVAVVVLLVFSLAVNVYLIFQLQHILR